MKKIKNFSLFSVLLVASIFTLFNSCEDPELPKAEITVLNEAGFPVHGAEVRVYAAPNGAELEQEKIRPTDPNGQVFFTFEYESIRDVVVTYDSPDYTYTLTGFGVLILEEDKVYQEVVTIR